MCKCRIFVQYGCGHAIQREDLDKRDESFLIYGELGEKRAKVKTQCVEQVRYFGKRRRNTSVYSDDCCESAYRNPATFEYDCPRCIDRRYWRVLLEFERSYSLEGGLEKWKPPGRFSIPGMTYTIRRAIQDHRDKKEQRKEEKEAIQNSPGWDRELGRWTDIESLAEDEMQAKNKLQKLLLVARKIQCIK